MPRLPLVLKAYIQVDGGTALDTAVHLGAGEDRLAVSINDAGGCSAVGVDEVTALVVLVIGAFLITIAERVLDVLESRYGLAVALQLGGTFLISCLDGRLDALYGPGIALGDDEGHGELGIAAVDGLRLPAVQVAENANTGDNFGRVSELCHNE